MRFNISLRMDIKNCCMKPLVLYIKAVKNVFKLNYFQAIKDQCSSHWTCLHVMSLTWMLGFSSLDIRKYSVTQQNDLPLLLARTMFSKVDFSFKHSEFLVWPNLGECVFGFPCVKNIFNLPASP